MSSRRWGRGAEDGVIIGPDEPQDDRDQLDGLESIKQLPDYVRFILLRQIPKIGIWRPAERPYAAFRRKNPEPLEPPVFGRLEVMQVFVGQLRFPAQASDSLFDGFEIKCRAYFFRQISGNSFRQVVQVVRFCASFGHRSLPADSHFCA